VTVAVAVVVIGNGGILFSIADEMFISVAVIEGGLCALSGYMEVEKLLLLPALLLLMMDVAVTEFISGFLGILG
jgi:hypothetical protein